MTEQQPKPQFGELLMDYLGRVGLKPKGIANILGVSEPDLEGIQSGTIRASRTLGFYERLFSDLPGISDSDAESLLAAEGAPPYIVETTKSSTPKAQLDDPNYPHYIDPSTLSEEELETITREVKMAMRHFLERNINQD